MNMKEWHRSRSVSEALYFAFRGVRGVFFREQNIRVQAIIGTLVVCALLFLRVSFIELIVGIFAILLVMTLEMMNTSIELIANLVHPEYSEAIKNAKDIAAGAVLLAGIGACIIGILIFVPAIFKL
jgi:diacylglycerol kinase